MRRWRLPGYGRSGDRGHGTGKTLLGAQFTQAGDAGERVLLLSFEESASQIVEIKREVEEFAPRRVVIDSMTALEHNADPREFREFGVGLSGYFKRRGVAALVTTALETLLGGESPTGVALSTVADAIVASRYLELDGELRRGILVVKLRGQAHDVTIQEYEITDDGIRVLGPFRGVAGIPEGQARFVRDVQQTGSAGSGMGDASGL